MENSTPDRKEVLVLDIATHTGYFSVHEAGT
nr:MAG TPA: putative AdoMet-dependent methyltransferase [Bacteriophage sp.]